MRKYIASILLIAGILALTGCHSAKEPDPETSGASSQTASAASSPLTSSPSPEHKDSPGQAAGSSSPSDTESMEPALSSPGSPDPGDQDPSRLPTPATSGALHVEGTRLVDKDGQAIQLKGISTHGLAWFPDYVNEDCFRELREAWNVNVIRLAMYTEEYGGYCSGGDQEALKALVKKGVDYATALDLYVIIDWHILSDGNPNRHLSEAKDFFTEMADLYAGYDNVLYEICNEPNGGTSWSDIKSYAEEIIPAIRTLDQDAVIIVGTPNWSQYVDQAAADPIPGYDNIMYALHFYAATHKESLRNTMTAAIDAGLPVFVSEYGICDASGNGSIDETQADLWVRTMDEYQVSYVAWNLSNKNETSAILKSDCNKTSGFTEEDLSPSGKWLYQMLAADDSTSTERTASTNVPTAATALPTRAAGSPTPSAALVNSWESDGKSFYQYELTLQNTSGTDYTQWSVTLSFSGSIALSDGWNGEYSVSGTDNSILYITNKDYNGSIPAGGSVSNIGFIVSGEGGLEICP